MRNIGRFSEKLFIGRNIAKNGEGKTIDEIIRRFDTIAPKTNG
jgi:hypothetical protein